MAGARVHVSMHVALGVRVCFSCMRAPLTAAPLVLSVRAVQHVVADPVRSDAFARAAPEVTFSARGAPWWGEASGTVRLLRPGERTVLSQCHI